MRRFLIGVAAIALAGPAVSQPAQPADPRDRELVGSMPHPAEIEAAGEAMDRVMGAVLDMPIGPLVDAIDAADPEGRKYRARHRRDETIGDLAADGDPYFEERMRDQIRGMTAGVGVMAEQLAVVAPEMRRALERAGADIDRAMRDARDRRERERDGGKR